MQRILLRNVDFSLCAGDSVVQNLQVPRISLQEASKSYPGKVDGPALDGVTMEIGDGELLVLAGPSGAGKTTLLRIIAGLETLSKGTLLFNDRPMNDVEPRDRNVAMVFQNPALYPHMTVRENMGFGLKVRGCPRAEREERVEETARLLDIRDLLPRRPAELSGGQAQRVALGRALTRRPEVFLLDEPFSHLDPLLAVDLRQLVCSIQKQTGATMIWSTHSRADLMALGARIALFRNGTLVQVAPLAELRQTPVNPFVTSFLQMDVE